MIQRIVTFYTNNDKIKSKCFDYLIFWSQTDHWANIVQFLTINDTHSLVIIHGQCPQLNLQ